MPLTLNTPETATTTGFQEMGVSLSFQTGQVTVQFQQIGSGLPPGFNLQITAPIAEAAFEAMAGASIRLKACAAIAAYLNLSGGSYTTT